MAPSDLWVVPKALPVTDGQSEASEVHTANLGHKMTGKTLPMMQAKRPGAETRRPCLQTLALRV